METEKETFAAKQCFNIQDWNLTCSNNPCNSGYGNNHHVVHNGYPPRVLESSEEPIDLTTFHSRNEDDCQVSNSGLRNDGQPFKFVSCPEANISTGKTCNFYPQKRRKKRKFIYADDGKLLLVTEANIQSPVTFSPSKQLEVLKAAKSLFSKRTRTLYHWMYPNAAKQQIKSAVSTSWESLGKMEKDFYISQVLGRFGFPQSNLMINPQLDSIKELPHAPPPPPELTIKNKTQELQNAISSILPENCNQLRGDTFEEFEEYSEKNRKRRGRPRGSNNNVRRIKYQIPQDFEDDPELSQELEKFAVKFDLNKIQI